MRNLLIVMLTLFTFACSEEAPKEANKDTAKEAKVEAKAEAKALEGLPTKDITIKTKDKEVKYNVEEAKTDHELKIGMMYRESLPTESGMIFEFDETDGAAMWMRNTKISLDMLFIAPDGKIVCIKEEATPMSEELIICNEKISAALEINAGEVKKHGIEIGDTIK